MWKEIGFREALGYGRGRQMVGEGRFLFDLPEEIVATVAESNHRPDTSNFDQFVAFDDKSVLGVVTGYEYHSEETGIEVWTEIWLWETEEGK